MKRTLAAAVAILIVGAWLWHRHGGTAGSPAGGSGAASASAATSGAKPPSHVVAIGSAADRRAIADRIAAAHERDHGRSDVHGALAAPAAPSLPTVGSLGSLGSSDTPATRATIKAAMHEVLPYLADCYAASDAELPQGELAVSAKLTLLGDADVGTLIDPHELADGQGSALPPQFDDCMRAALQNLELPPLAEGDTLDVTYPFIFSR